MRVRSFAGGVVASLMLLVLAVGQPAFGAFKLEYAKDAKRTDFAALPSGGTTVPESRHLRRFERGPSGVGISERPQTSANREPQVRGADFWRALSNCEDPTGVTGSQYRGYFEFADSTGDAVGISGGESYEEQRAGAIEWARRLRAEGTSPGSTAGWPVCWHVAKRQVGYAPY